MWQELYFYRDKEKREEIDLYNRKNTVLYPIEIKKTVFIKNMSFQNFEVLQNLKVPIGHDGLLCSVNAPLPISKEVDAIPNWIHLKFKLLTSIITKS